MSRAAVGSLRRRLAALEPVDVDDGSGGLERSFVERFEIWASVEPLGARPQFLAARGEVEVTHRIHIRAGGGVASGWRLRDGGRLFDLLFVPADESATGRLACRAREVT